MLGRRKQRARSFTRNLYPCPKTTHTLWMETAHAHTKHVCACVAHCSPGQPPPPGSPSRNFQTHFKNVYVMQTTRSTRAAIYTHACTHISSCETHALPDFVNYTNVSGPGTYACVCVLVAENYGKVSSTLFHVHSVCQPSVVLLPCFVCVCVKVNLHMHTNVYILTARVCECMYMHCG